MGIEYEGIIENVNITGSKVPHDEGIPCEIKEGTIITITGSGKEPEKYRFFGSIRAFELYNIDKNGVLGHLNDDKKYIFVENKYYKIHEYNKDGWVFKRIKDKMVK